MIDITPNPILGSLGPIEIRWYGLAYVAAIVGGTWLATREARRRGERTEVILDGLIFIAAAALIGGRLYHVIDQWAYYSSHLPQIVLPPYSGLGVYGGLFTGLLATLWYARRHQLNFWRWADILAPAILLAQVIGRWGNFANQELYGPPTTLPWGIAIQCQYRISQYACPPGSDPAATLGQHFIPLFLYESLLSLVGVFVMLWLWRRFTSRGRLLIAGDIGMLYFVWYGLERSLLEFFRSGYDWTFFGLGTAQIVGIGAAVAAIAVIVARHRLARGRPPEEPAGERSGDVATAAPDRSIVPSDAAVHGAPDVPLAGPADS
jgi:phosphatidylglycerol:prolipoprotein diacylglycerol transferase